MVELTSGSKRRLSDADENERITLRQMVLNMSICKLHKDQGRKEPSLLRSVAITNTVRYIENEMDEEMLLNLENTNHTPSYETVECVDGKNSIISDKFIMPTKNDLVKTMDNVEKKSISNERCKSAEQQNKFGAVGDHRKSTGSKKIPPTAKSVAVLNGFLWDSLALPSLNSLPAFDALELDTNFPDVDITLYDYDNNVSPLHMQASNDWRVFPASCAMEYESRKPDSFFEELDQIMQVLVGM